MNGRNDTTEWGTTYHVSRSSRLNEAKLLNTVHSSSKEGSGCFGLGVAAESNNLVEHCTNACKAIQWFTLMNRNSSLAFGLRAGHSMVCETLVPRVEQSLLQNLAGQ